MSLSRCVVLAALAGCTGGHGTDVEVTVPAGVDTVELLVAPEACTPGDQVPTCDSGVAWDTATTKQPGDIFILDSDTALTAAVDAGHVTFQLQAASETSVKRVAVLGYKAGTLAAAEVLDDVTIHGDAAEEWQVALDPVADFVKDDPRTMDRMHVWRRMDPTRAKCLAIEHASDGDASYEFLVPPGDTDCDDEMPECEPFIYKFKPSTPAAASCVTTAGPDDPGSCTLGTMMCADGVTGAACTQLAQEFCTVDVICGHCSNMLDPMCVGGVVAANLGDMTSPMPALRCTFPHADTTHVPCNDNGTMNASGYLVIPDMILGANTCESLGFRPAMTPLPGVMSTVSAGMATFTATKVSSLPGQATARCAFRIDWTGTASSLAKARGFADIVIHETKTHLLLPFDLGFAAIAGCPANDVSLDTCSLAAPNSPNTEVFGDKLFQCAN